MTALLEVIHLNKNFGGLKVTDDVSITLPVGARTALIGPNGAGKTTLVNLITGHLRPTSGEVLLDGHAVTHASAVARVRAGMVRSFQVTRLFPDMTPTEHLALAVLQRDRRTGRMAGHFRAMPDVMSEVEERLALFQIAHLADRRVSEIAYGEQRLVELSLALALKPKVLLLDEPGAGVPRSDMGLIVNAIAGLPADLAVLVIDHDMDFVFRFAREVVVLAAGRVIFAGSPAAIMTDAGVREAYLGSHGLASAAA